MDVNLQPFVLCFNTWVDNKTLKVLQKTHYGKKNKAKQGMWTRFIVNILTFCLCLRKMKIIFRVPCVLLTPSVLLVALKTPE